MIFRRALEVTYRTARRVVVFVIGLTVVIVGVVMLVTPGPGIGAIIGGLAILGLEFAWARRWLAALKAKGMKAVDKVRHRNHPGSDNGDDHNTHPDPPDSEKKTDVV